MPPRIVVTLTAAEARALAHMAGNSCDYPDVMNSLFPTQRALETAHEAYRKLRIAMRSPVTVPSTFPPPAKDR